MEERFVAVEGALQAGRREEACDLIVAALTENPEAPRQVYRVLLINLYRLKRYDEGADWSLEAFKRYPGDFEICNLTGVLNRRMKRWDTALKALDQAQRINPKDLSPLINKGNIYNDRADGPAAEAIFAKLVRQDPRNAEHQRALGRALANQEKFEQALVRFKQAVTLKPTYVDAWLDYSGVLSRLYDNNKAVEIIDRAIETVPGEPRLYEAKAATLLRAGRSRAVEEFLTSLLPEHDDAGWLHFQLGAAIADTDRPRANQHFERAVALEPERKEFLTALAESLERTRVGDEAANIEQSYAVIKRALALGDLNPGGKKIASEIMVRLGAFDEIDELGTFEELGREWASTGKQTALLKMLSRVKTPEDRRELLHQHRIWGKLAEAAARRQPIKRPATPRPPGKMRLGFMSSDLRNHPVAYFCLPLFTHADRERFEIYCYSFFTGAEDRTQTYITQHVDHFRWRRDISEREAAKMIADDQLDMLIELGGSTHMNKIGVMAYRPAELNASWLGYPHSAGLNTIDYLVADPLLAPEDPKLLLEKPLMMPKTWITLGEQAFPETHQVIPEPPSSRKGYVTFGTANNPYKYNRDMLDVWAQVVAAVPDARFLFVRPEGGGETFRKNMRKAFAARGVAEDRVLFQPIRGAHMPFYNDIDIALDTFPQTGGTTTCEAGWMGVPTVTIVGEALFERLSYSILTNIGLGDLCTRSTSEFMEVAVRLAGDRARLQDLRANLRSQMKASPLGQTKAFARDFYDTVANAIGARRATRKAG